MFPNRMLMNSQPNDGAPTGAPPGQVAPVSPPAQGTAAEPSMLDQIAKLIDTKMAEQRNGIFADLRKTGAFGKAAKNQEEAATPSTTGLTDDVQQLIARERAFTRAAATAKLTDAQFGRMERAWQADKPDDSSGWVRDYLADLGVQQPTAPAAPQVQPAPVRSGPPASDSGSPAPVTAPSDQSEPWRMTDDDYQSLVRRDGIPAVGAKFREQFHRALKGRRIRLK